MPIPIPLFFLIHNLFHSETIKNAPTDRWSWRMSRQKIANGCDPLVLWRLGWTENPGNKGEAHFSLLVPCFLFPKSSRFCLKCFDCICTPAVSLLQKEECHQVEPSTGMFNLQAACSPAWLAKQHLLLHAVTAAALHCKVAPDIFPSLSNSQAISILLTLCQLKAGHREGSAVQCWLKWWRIAVCVLIRWLNKGLWTAKNTLLCFPFW